MPPQNSDANSRCEYFTLIETYPSGGRTAFNVACRDGWAAHTVYRSLPVVVATSTTAASSTAAGTSSSSGVPSSTGGAAATTSRANPSPPSPTATPRSGGNGNKAWIAGVVIGPVVAVAVIAAMVVWMLLRRRKKKRAAGGVFPLAQGGPQPQRHLAPTFVEMPAATQEQYRHPGEYYGAKPYGFRPPGAAVLVELPPSGAEVVELPSPRGGGVY